MHAEKRPSFLTMIAFVVAFTAVAPAPWPALCDDCSGLGVGFKCDWDVAYGEPFPVTELRSAWADDAEEDPPDCSNDDVDLYEEMVAYNTRSLDIYYPDDASVSRTVVFYVHGGGWEGGYKEWYRFVPTVFTGEKGWVTVVINYRLVADETFTAATCPTREACEGADAPDPWEKSGVPPEYTDRSKAAWYPDNMDDVAEALEWVVDHISAPPYYGDTRNIFVFGHSAGGHLVSLLATHPKFDEKRYGQGSETYSLRDRIRGAISMSGVYSLKNLSDALYHDLLDQLFKGCGHNLEPKCTDAVLDEASPLYYVEQGITLPPFHILHAEQDLPEFTAQTLAFEQALTDLNLDVTRSYLEKFTHVTEMMAIQYTGSTEPLTAALGDPDGMPPTSCFQDFGPNPKPGPYKNPTDMIVDWIESRSFQPPIVPLNGIWKLQQDEASIPFYLQKYTGGSCILVFTTDGRSFVAFQDLDVNDGIGAEDDLGGRGFSLSLALTSQTEGQIDVTLANGRFTGAVQRAFADRAGTGSSSVEPANGIWKPVDSLSGGPSFYLQKYESGSCVMVCTRDAQTFVAYQVPECGGGIHASDDVGGQGYTAELETTDGVHGRLDAALPGEAYSGEVALVFEDTP
ncbi:MAG: alpha/beta hydrolase [Deltaproteobacteria bacterium]|nr:alpha/beta hydrolase [Deltaproteobacteria bacterium]